MAVTIARDSWDLTCSMQTLTNGKMSGMKGETGDGVRLVLNFQRLFLNGATEEYGPRQEGVESCIQRNGIPGDMHNTEGGDRKGVWVPLPDPAEV